MTEKKQSLIDISWNIQNILEGIIESGGEISDESFAELEAFRGKLETKAESIAYIINNVMDARINRLKELEKQASNKRKAEENAKKRLKAYLKQAMEATDTQTIKCDLYTISLAKGKDSVEITNINEIPNEYINTTVEHKPDKKLLLSDLKDGKEIKGAKITTGETSLRIR